MTLLSVDYRVAFRDVTGLRRSFGGHYLRSLLAVGHMTPRLWFSSSTNGVSGPCGFRFRYLVDCFLFIFFISDSLLDDKKERQTDSVSHASFVYNTVLQAGLCTIGERSLCSW